MTYLGKLKLMVNVKLSLKMPSINIKIDLFFTNLYLNTFE